MITIFLPHLPSSDVATMKNKIKREIGIRK